MKGRGIYIMTPKPIIVNRVGGSGTLVTPYLIIASLTVARTFTPVRATEFFDRNADLRRAQG
jgi:hypothetical protein